ncbi:BMP-binding endothelial regulator protein isoform X2 [Cryptotermes secundus]|nr:BMP-binding endothelial regulator protein isoform X2 [Cryptotermes secundus]
MKCFTCWCRKRQVECEPEKCPGNQGCYRLLNESKDGCCRVCKGCIYEGVHHPSGSEWSDPSRPCTVMTCKAGVVTESEIQCYTPCRNPQPPAPGQCCPTCPGCRINGQLVTENRDVGIPEDPCLKCRCKAGWITCSKQACPVLHCPQKNISRVPGECCKQCVGSRYLMEPPKGGCLLGFQVHLAGKAFRLDHCTQCSCLNATSICRRKACPVLECAPERQVSTPGDCCPHCPPILESTTTCTIGGRTYEDGESWELDPCKTCVCQQGQVRCAMQMCPQKNMVCPSNYKMVQRPGECCPRCVESDGICTVFGDPHYRTFDGKFYSFQGSCKYQLAADCLGHTFSIRVTNDARGTRTSSWTKTVAIKVGEVKINLGQKMRLKVNGHKVTAPYRLEGKATINKTEDSLIVETHIGVKVLWDGSSFLEVSAPASYKGRLCGLCGNFNLAARDDFTTRRGRLVLDPDKFGTSWRVGGKRACARPDGQSQCQHQGSHKSMENIRHCGPLQTVFSACHKTLNFMTYLQSCILDMCECPLRRCYCESFTAYAHECMRLGVQLPDWRAATGCPSAWTEHKGHAVPRNRPPPPRLH